MLEVDVLPAQSDELPSVQAGVEAGRPHRPILAGKGIDGRPDGV